MMTQIPIALHSPSFQWIFILVPAGVIGTISAIMVILSLKLAPASIVLPLGYLEIVSSSIIGAIIFDEAVTLNMIAGSILILFSSFLITRTGTSQTNLDEQFHE